jgi:hypothetical protein
VRIQTIEEKKKEKRLDLFLLAPLPNFCWQQQLLLQDHQRVFGEGRKKKVIYPPTLPPGFLM